MAPSFANALQGGSPFRRDTEGAWSSAGARPATGWCLLLAALGARGPCVEGKGFVRICGQEGKWDVLPGQLLARR